MPTLLEALEEKYGFAETIDIEAEPELLMLRLPKRTPRQRWLSFIINLLVRACRYFSLETIRQLTIMTDNLNTVTTEGVSEPTRSQFDCIFYKFSCRKRIIKKLALLIIIFLSRLFSLRNFLHSRITKRATSSRVERLRNHSSWTFRRTEKEMRLS